MDLLSRPGSKTFCKVYCVSLLGLLMAACGGGGGDSGGVSGGTTAPPPATATLTASPTSVTMNGATTLTWSSTNANSCTASGGWSGGLAASGSRQVTGITQATTYTLTCGSASTSVTITIAASAGLASYSKMTATLDPASLTRYTIQVDLSAFNADTYEAATVSALTTTANNLNAPGGSQVLGQQKYTLQSISCSPKTAIGSYSALLLFDRSGSMLSNDPSNDTLAAGREFVNRMDSGGLAWIAAFPGGYAGRPTSPVTFYGTVFTADKPALLANMAGVGAAQGDTPLWDSMIASIAKFPATAVVPGTSRALLTFSDGEDTASTGSSVTVQTNALARGVKVFAINLRNSNSQTVDSIALATGGSVFSTDDAKKLLAFYGTLGKLLAGTGPTCTATIVIEFVANASVGEVGYGPGSRVKPSLQFAGTSGSATPVQIDTLLDLPFYPGRKVGNSTGGKSIFETDVVNFGGTNCVVIAGGLARNNCTTPIHLTLCNSAVPSTCSRAALQSNQTMPAYATNSYAQCNWREPFDKYEATRVSGTAPVQVFAAWNATATSYTCVNTLRGPF